MNWNILKTYFPNHYGDIEHMFILIIRYLQQYRLDLSKLSCLLSSCLAHDF